MRRVIGGAIRAALRLGPRPFRERFTAEIVETTAAALDEARRRRGWWAMAGLAVRAVVDAVAAAAAERRLDAAAGGAWSDWRGDVRDAWRGCRRAPVFTMTIVLTIGLSLGLAAAVFSFADGYLFRGLPIADGDRLYRIRQPNRTPAALLAVETAALRQGPLAELGFVEWSVDSMGLRELVLPDGRVDLFAYEVSRGFRRTVALPLAAGHDFTDSDHEPQPIIPAWLSYRFWTRVFGGDPDVVGRVYPVTSYRDRVRELRIAGVLDRAFASFDLNNEPPDIVVPERGVDVSPQTYSAPIVRLPREISIAQAEAQIAAGLPPLAAAGDGRPRVVQLRPLRESQVAGGRPTARVLFAGALLGVLLAVVNVIHLMLTRGAARAGEIATRAAIGATRWRLARLFLTESLVLGVTGIALGLVIGGILSSIIAALVPGLPTSGRNLALVPMAFDVRVIGFAISLGTIVALTGGVWPAWRALRRPFAWGARSAGGVGGDVSRRASRALLASELAIASVVLLGTVFIGLGIWRYLHQPLGVDFEDRLSVHLQPAEGRPLTSADVRAAAEALRQLDGVAAVGAAEPTSVTAAVEIPGRAVAPGSVRAQGVSPGYFDVWRVPLDSGRLFDPREYVTNAPVAIVDTAMARTFWPDGSPLGHVVRIGDVMREIVGVVASRRTSLSRPATPVAFIPAVDATGTSRLVVWLPGRADGTDTARLTDAVERALPGVTAGAAPVEFSSLSTMFMREIGEPRFQAPIIAAFGVLTFVLAGVGVFGLVSYLVARRLREFGILIALGARPAAIWRRVMRESVVPALVGLAVGLPAAVALESIVQSTMFGWPSSGPVAAAVVSVMLLTVATLAALAPARRAMRVDPVQVLRAE